MNNQNVLEVVEVGEEQIAIDSRKFRTIGVVPSRGDDEPVSTSRMHKVNVWNRQPVGGSFNPYYDKIREGTKISGQVVTADTVPYYIPNNRGKYICTSGEFEGERFNKATVKTYVVLEDQTLKQLLRNDGLSPDQSAEERSRYGVSITDIEVRLLTEVEMAEGPRMTDPEEQRRRNFETSKQRNLEREERAKELQEEGPMPEPEESIT